MSVLHVHPVPATERAKIKFNKFRNIAKAPFVKYADFESILSPLNFHVQRTKIVQQHMFAASAILCSHLHKFNQQTMKIGPHARSDLFDQLIKLKPENYCNAICNLKIKCLNIHQQA